MVHKSRIRWRIVPAFLCGIFGVITMLGYIGMAAAVAYYHLRYGPIGEVPEDSTLKSLSLHPLRILGVCFGIGGGVMGIVAARAWFRETWRLAVVSTLLFWAFSVLANVLCF